MRRFLCAAGLGILALLTSGCEKETPKLAVRAPLAVMTVDVTPSDEPVWTEVLGRTEGGQEVRIYAQVTGTLERVLFKEGESVKAGDALYQIDDSTFRTRFDSAHAARLQAQANLDQAQRELVRTEKLFKAGAQSRKAYDDAVSLKATRTALLTAAKAAENEARITLERTTVRAPAGGLINKTLVNPGALINAQSTQLTSLTQHDDVRVSFAPSERVLGDTPLTPDTRIEITAENGMHLPGHLDFIAQAVTPETGTRQLRARLDAQNAVLPGSFVRVRLQTGERKGAYRVPQKAVRQLPDGTYAVYVFENGKAVNRPVTVDVWAGTDWLVTGGLKTGDKVIINQLLKLQNGTAVRPAETADGQGKGRKAQKN